VSEIDYIVRKVVYRSNGILNQTNPSTQPTVLLLSIVVVKFGTELPSATALGLNVNICEPMTTVSWLQGCSEPTVWEGDEDLISWGFSWEFCWICSTAKALRCAGDKAAARGCFLLMFRLTTSETENFGRVWVLLYDWRLSTSKFSAKPSRVDPWASWAGGGYFMCNECTRFLCGALVTFLKKWAKMKKWA
jgi:hypothetical protein